MKSLFFITLCTIILASCGRREIACTPETVQAKFITYNASELDSLVVLRYTVGTNFNSIVDTVVLSSLLNTFQVNGDTTTVSIPNFKMNDKGQILDFDVRIINSFDNKVTFISNVITSVSSTRISKFAMDPGTVHCSSPIISLNVNGLVTEGANVFINK